MQKTEYNGIVIDYSRDNNLTKFGIDTLKDRYLIPGENSPQEAFARAAIAYADNLDHAQRIYDYASNLWFMFSTPILSNGGTKRGLGISCYLSNIADKRSSILDHYTENGWLSSQGGGIGSYWGHIRSSGVKTSKGSISLGSVPFIKVVDAEVMAFRQGYTRRASYAAYMPIDHPDIEEFISIRKPTGGDSNRKCLNIHNAICISDKFMEAVLDNKPWDLIDPHTREVRKTVKARELWQLILETRISTGEPYILFSDTTNEKIYKGQKDIGMNSIDCSNLCSEITLYTDENRTAVCCLSSVNLDLYDEWKDDPLFIDDIIRFLDNNITNFIDTAGEGFEKATYSASQERALGLGAMGFHSYLQRKNIPFENPIAVGLNKSIFENIKSKAIVASKKIALEKGKAPESTESDNIRNVYLLAIAPNASSSIICGGVSPSVEPLRANAFTQKTMSGSFLVKNKSLEKRLRDLKQNTKDVWKSIIINEGSVQHLDFLSDWDKEVFKTAIEIDQRWIVQHASDRQEYICQSQSINLFFQPNVDVKYLNEVHIMAWEKKLKTLYYCRSVSLKNVEAISKQIDQTKTVENDECFSCQG